MENNEELEALGIIGKEETKIERNKELEAIGIVEDKIARENKTKNIGTNNSYTSLLVTSFLFPLIGFIAGAIHIDSNNQLARQCLKFAWIGIIAVVVIVTVVIACAFA